MRFLTGSIPFSETANSSGVLHDLILPTSGVALSHQLNVSLKHVEGRFTHLPEPYSCCILFFTVAAPGYESSVFFVRRATLEVAWREGATRVRQWAWVRKLDAVDLRIDWPHDIVVMDGHSFQMSALTSRQNSTWALADEDLENAELLPPIRLGGDGCLLWCASGMVPGRKSVASTVAAASAPSAPTYLLMQMRGVHTNRHGVQIALPRVHAPLFGKAASTSSWLPYLATLKLLCSQQGTQGTWDEAVEVTDHLGMTYALLLAQRHITGAEAVHGMLNDAIRRAVSYVLRNTDELAEAKDPHVARALCMLVCTRYLLNLQGSGELFGQTLPLEVLVKSLGMAEEPVSPQAQEWVGLAFHAFELFREHAGKPGIPSSSAGSTHVEPYELDALLEAFLMSLTSGAEHPLEVTGSEAESERWLAIAIAEGLSVEPCPELLQDRCRHWASHLQRFISSSRKQAVRPEVALFLPAAVRERAAFIQVGEEERQLMVDGRAVAQLLIRCFAVDQIFRAL